jgi:hypothetical protein
MAGLERSGEEPSLPFFIEWEAGTPYPGRALAQSAMIEQVRLQGDPDRIEEWLGGADVPISVSEGRPALRSIVLDNGVLEPSRWA